MKQALKRFCLLGLFATSFTAKAQFEDIANILASGEEAINPIMSGYLTPALDNFGYSLNTGWAQTAKTHKTLGFDLTFQVGITPFSEAQQLYTPDFGANSNVTLQNGPTAPTIAGSSDDVPVYNVSGSIDFGGQTIQGGYDFNGPAGSNAPAAGAPILQLGIGLPMGTDLKVRYFPDVDYEGAGISLWGIGLQHNIKQWIPVVKALPFKLSVLAGYTRFNLDYANLNINTANVSGTGSFGWQTDAWTAQLIASKSLSVLTVYAAAGYGSANSTFALNGAYTVAGTGGTEVNIQDPVDFDTERAGVLGKVGVRLKFLFFSVFGEAILQGETAYNGGIGIGFR